MLLKPTEREVALYLAERGGHRRLRDIAADLGRYQTTVYGALRRLTRLGVVVVDPAGWRLRGDLVISRKGLVYQQLPLFEAVA